MGNGSSELRALMERVARLEIRVFGLEAEKGEKSSDGGSSAAAVAKTADDGAVKAGKKRGGG